MIGDNSSCLIEANLSSPLVAYVAGSGASVPKRHDRR